MTEGKNNMKKPWKASVLTIFPDMFPGPLGQSIVGKALEEKLWELSVSDIREFAEDKHKTVDDRPFGGGSGMVMRADVIGKAIESASAASTGRKPRIIYMSPKGRPFSQALAEEFTREEEIIIICGRYEGIDERVMEAFEVEEVSIGDYILSGGEIAAYSVIDACVRLISGVLGNALSLSEESFGVCDHAGLLEYPHYTRPKEWNGLDVPKVLLSGNHEDIRRWRLEQAEKVTKARRKDLWEKYSSAKQKL